MNENESEYYLEKIQSMLDIRRSDAGSLLCLMQKRKNLDEQGRNFDDIFDEVIQFASFILQFFLG